MINIILNGEEWELPVSSHQDKDVHYHPSIQYSVDVGATEIREEKKTDTGKMEVKMSMFAEDMNFYK